ncbi:MAG TPA: hypothetical protein ENK43_08990 [Planctomycetes bacterium]|nr:hypothetical protein [Planctomycetota bacterium]
MRWLPRSLLVTAVFGLAMGLQLGLHHADAVLAYPLAVDDGEGLMIALADMEARGAPLYSPLDEEPYVANIYPPLFSTLMVIFRKPAGSLLAAGRWLSLGGALLTALGLAWCVAVITQGSAFPRILGGAAAALIFLNDPETLYWGCVARVDVLGLGLEMLGLAVLLSRPRKRPWNGAALALFLLAGFTKQSLVAGAVTGLVTLFLLDRLRALRLATVFVATGALLVGLLVLATKGLAWEHLVVANHITWSPRLALYWWKVFLFRHWGLVGLAVLAVFVLGRFRSTAFPKARGAAILLPVALAASLTSGRLGSNTNHLMEALAAMSIVIGVALATLVTRHGRVGLLLLVPAILALVPIRGGLRLPAETGAWWMGPGPEARHDATQLLEALRSIPGDILSSHLDLAPLAAKPLLYQTAVMSELAARGLWDPGPLVRRVQDKTFSVIILDAPIDMIDVTEDVRFPPAVLIAIRENYTLRMRRGRYSFHVPRH